VPEPNTKGPTRQTEYDIKIIEFNQGTRDKYFKLTSGKHPVLPFWGYEYCRINSLGFRGKDFLPYSKGRGARIICVGESSTVGMESTEEHTWPGRLEYYLNQRFPDKFEVINTGFPGSKSLDQLNLIRYELVKYQPDLILIYAGINDIELALRDKRKAINRFVYQIHASLYYRFMPYTLMVEKLSTIIQRSANAANVYIFKPRSDYAQNIEGVIKTCQENNVGLIFIRQLLYYRGGDFILDNSTPQELKSFRGPRQKNYIKNFPAGSRHYRHNQQVAVLQDLCRKYNVEMLDFRKDFLENMHGRPEDFFIDYVHLKPEANDLLARLISQRIIEEPRIKKALK
jgi:lysophospholipase L1-like esterase